MNMTSEILDNQQLEEQEICYRNNKSKEHDYFAINYQYLSKSVIETEYICLECGKLHYVYNYLEDSEIGI